MTYYTPEEPTGHVVRDEPLHGRGKVWTLGAYEHPTYPSPADVRVGEAGLRVWMVIELLRSFNDNSDAVLERYGETVTRADLDTAIWYYEQNREAIDRKLKEEEA
ncbi:MAG: hypothetical protein WD939_08140 [Dehalococcoidia bacterium]